jgi:hypothetical protein
MHQRVQNLGITHMLMLSWSMKPYYKHDFGKTTKVRKAC